MAVSAGVIGEQCFLCWDVGSRVVDDVTFKMLERGKSIIHMLEYLSVDLTKGVWMKVSGADVLRLQIW